MCSDRPCAAGYAEPLPQSCPPRGADSSGGQYHRLVESIPPTIEDFKSHRERFPDRAFTVTECRARSVSLLKSVEQCNQLLKLPTLRGRLIVVLEIPSNTGAMQKTGGPHHYSWWRCGAFNPIPYCREVR